MIESYSYPNNVLIVLYEHKLIFLFVILIVPLCHGGVGHCANTIPLACCNASVS